MARISHKSPRHELNRTTSRMVLTLNNQRCSVKQRSEIIKNFIFCNHGKNKQDDKKEMFNNFLKYKLTKMSLRWSLEYIDNTLNGRVGKFLNECPEECGVHLYIRYTCIL